MSRLDELAGKAKFSGWRRAAWMVALLVASLIAWASFAELEEVATAAGEVVPRGQVKVVQHLEGGIIERIYVTEGDVVAAGDPLVQLDLGLAGASTEELRIENDALILTRTRLEAEAQGKELTFSGTEAEGWPDLVATEQQTFMARKSQLASTLAVLGEQVRQRKLDLAQLKAKRKSSEANLSLTRQKFAMSEELVVEGLTSKMDHLQLQREVEALVGELSVLEPALPRAAAAVAEARERIHEEELKFQRGARDELGRVEVKIARMREALSRAAGQVMRTEIKSPIDGVVKSLRYHTIGGVVRPGEAIMEIVPTGDNLVIEAKLSPTDIGYVRVGQPAVVKISTYEFSRYGGLDATVAYVSADSHTDPGGGTYFRVVAETDRTYLGDAPGDLPIMPGMQATVEIRTGNKSVAQYLLKPLLKVQSEAFHER